MTDDNHEFSVVLVRKEGETEWFGLTFLPKDKDQWEKFVTDYGLVHDHGAKAVHLRDNLLAGKEVQRPNGNFYKIVTLIYLPV